MKRIQNRAVAAAVAIALLATACSGDTRSEKRSAQRVGPTAEVVDGRATRVMSPSGAIVTIPADDATTGGTLTIGETPPPEALTELPSTRDSGTPPRRDSHRR